MGKANHDFAVIAVGHFLDFHGVFHGAGNRLLHVACDMMFQHHFDIVQTLGGRGGDDDIVRLDDIVLDFLIGTGGASELVAVNRKVCLAYIVDADDFAAQTDNGTAVMAGNVTRTDHKYLHGLLLYALTSFSASATMFSTVTPFIASSRS